MSMEAAEKKKVLPLLAELCSAVEELLLAGLTTASKSTIERMDVTFREISRLRLLRLGSTLRIANEEVSRFTHGSDQFSARRLSFFLSRTWLLASGMQRAIEKGDDPALDRLLFTPAAQGITQISVIALGVSKRVVPGAFATFEFRLRCVKPVAGLLAGDPLVWSCVFPMRKDLDLPAEAFLHLPQKQKFKPSVLLEKKVVDISRCSIAPQPTSAARIILSDASQVEPGAPFSDWHSLCKWDLPAAAKRLKDHTPTPLDLDIELQEEVILPQWSAGQLNTDHPEYDILPLQSGALSFEARLDRGPSGTPLHAAMRKMAGLKRRPPLFGVAHYESCRILLQPLSALGKDGPEYLTVSPDKISQAALVKAMKFT